MRLRAVSPLKVTGFLAKTFLSGETPSASSPLRLLGEKATLGTLCESHGDNLKNGQTRRRVPFPGRCCDELLRDINVSSWLPSTAPSPWGARGGPATSFPTLLPLSCQLLQSRLDSCCQERSRSCSPSTGTLAAGVVALVLR